jgi:glycine cleavage system H protein
MRLSLKSARDKSLQPLIVIFAVILLPILLSSQLGTSSLLQKLVPGIDAGEAKALQIILLLLLTLVGIVVWRFGRKVKAGESCCVVESVKAAFDIYAPVSGEIVAANSEAAKNPALVNQEPYGKGWLFKIAVSAPEGSANLMSAADYEKFLASEAVHGSH